MEQLDKITSKTVLILGRNEDIQQVLYEFWALHGSDSAYLSYEPLNSIYYQDYPEYIEQILKKHKANKTHFITTQNREFIELMVHADHPMQVVTVRGEGSSLHPYVRSREYAQDLVDNYAMELRA